MQPETITTFRAHCPSSRSQWATDEALWQMLVAHDRVDGTREALIGYARDMETVLLARAPRQPRLTAEVPTVIAARLLETSDWVAIREIVTGALAEQLAQAVSADADPSALRDLERMRERVALWRAGTRPITHALGPGADEVHDLIRATPALWAACALVGTQACSDGSKLELRNCHCGSTISKRVR